MCHALQIIGNLKQHIFLKIVIPFLNSKQDPMKLPQSQPALAIFDAFKGQQTEKI